MSDKDLTEMEVQDFPPLVLKEMEGLTDEITAFCDEAIEYQRDADVEWFKQAGYVQLEPWESPRCPSGELGEVFRVAESFRQAEHAPAVRLDHFLLALTLNRSPFLLALTLNRSPFIAKAILKVYEGIEDEWHKNLNERRK